VTPLSHLSPKKILLFKKLKQINISKLEKRRGNFILFLQLLHPKVCVAYMHEGKHLA